MPFQKAINELYGYLDDQRKLLARSGQIPVAKVRPSDVVDAVPNFVGEVGKAIGKNSYAPEQLRSNYAEFYGFSPTEVRVNQPRQLRQNVIPDLANQVAVNYPIEVTNRHILKDNPFQFDDNGILSGYGHLSEYVALPQVEADPLQELANLNASSAETLKTGKDTAPVIQELVEPPVANSDAVSFDAPKVRFSEALMQAHNNNDADAMAHLEKAYAKSKYSMDVDSPDFEPETKAMIMEQVRNDLAGHIQALSQGQAKRELSPLEKAKLNPIPLKEDGDKLSPEEAAAAVRKAAEAGFTGESQKPLSSNGKPPVGKPQPKQPVSNQTVEVQTDPVAEPQAQPTGTETATATKQPVAVDSTGMPLWQKGAIGAAGLGAGYLAYKAFLDNQERERQELAMQQQQLGMGGYGQRPSYF